MGLPRSGFLLFDQDQKIFQHNVHCFKQKLDNLMPSITSGPVVNWPPRLGSGSVIRLYGSADTKYFRIRNTDYLGVIFVIGRCAQKVAETIFYFS
jgi:hypothetical protein